jgi:DNA-binding transcriptional MocR family regulator
MQNRVAYTSTDVPSSQSLDRPLYLRVAAEIEQQIRSGTLRVGEKVPSIRDTKKGWQVSTSTALQAYFWLENRELIEARTRSGSYVRVPFSDLAPEPGFEPSRSVPRDAGLDARLGQLLQLGAAVPSPDFYPVRKLNQAIRRIIRENSAHTAAATSFRLGMQNCDYRSQSMLPGRLEGHLGKRSSSQSEPWKASPSAFGR